eukprot:gene30986-41248_t
MSKDGGGLRVRVKTARRRTAQSTRWLDRQLNDPYVKRAKADGFRSRAAYKLSELDQRFDFLKRARFVVDLGIAPGGWSQVVHRKMPKAKIVGIDLLPVDPLDGVTILQMDFMDDAAPERLLAELGGAPDLVLSAALAFAIDVLEPGGVFIGKVFAGGADTSLVTELKRNFKTVKHAKPPASRKGSSEWY